MQCTYLKVSTFPHPQIQEYRHADRCIGGHLALFLPEFRLHNELLLRSQPHDHVVPRKSRKKISSNHLVKINDALFSRIFFSFQGIVIQSKRYYAVLINHVWYILYCLKFYLKVSKFRKQIFVCFWTKNWT